MAHESLGIGIEQVRRIRIEQYHHMVRAGIFDDDPHVELLDGILVEMAPQGRAHAYAIQKLIRAIVPTLPADLELLAQLPLTLIDDSEPEPDLAVVRTSEATRDGPHPGCALLVIEVATTSLAKDRGPKSALYARASIPEYWIVNTEDQTVEVSLDPDAANSRYGCTQIFRLGDTLETRAIPGLQIAVANFLD